MSLAQCISGHVARQRTHTIVTMFVADTAKISMSGGANCRRLLLSF